MLADEEWFWIGTALALGVAIAAAPRYRRATAALRRAGADRRLVDPGPGLRVESAPGGFWSDPTWLLLLLGLWVGASPWIWGYEDVPGAVEADLISGAAVVALTLAGILYPALLAPVALIGGWLVLAPWIVGYGDEGGPVGISDVLAGLAITALSFASLAAAARRTGPAHPVARMRNRS